MGCCSDLLDSIAAGCGEESCPCVLTESFFPAWVRLLLLAAVVALPTVQAARWLTAKDHLDTLKKRLRCLREEVPSLKSEICDLHTQQSRDNLSELLTRRRAAVREYHKWTMNAEESTAKVEKMRMIKECLLKELDALVEERDSIRNDLCAVLSVMEKHNKEEC